MVEPTCSQCGSDWLMPIRTLHRSPESDDVALEEYICRDCESTLEFHYSLQLQSVECEDSYDEAM